MTAARKTAPRTRKATAAATPHEEPRTFAAFASYDDIAISRRELVAAVVNVFVGIVTGSFIIVMAEMLAAALFAATASLFLSMVTVALGWAIAIVASIIIGSRVAKYIAQGKAEDDLHRARSWVYDKWEAVRNKASSGFVHRAPSAVH